MKAKEFIKKYIGKTALEAYLLGEYGEKFGIYRDGAFLVGQDVGNEIADDEAPISIIACPGFDDIDVSLYTEGWTEPMGFVEELEERGWRTNDNRVLTLEECVIECCQNGDVDAEIENLRRLLLDNFFI